MEKVNATKILQSMIQLLIAYLEELSECEKDFEYGEKVAYTECLEWIQNWRKADKYGLDFVVEQKYPLD